jgi:hypothetical protein
MTIAEQLARAAQALEQIGSHKNSAPANGETAPSSSTVASPALSPAPAGSLSAELIRTDGLLRYGRG